MSDSYLNDNDKLQNLINEIKFPRNFRKKLSELYLTEFDEKFDQILIKKETEFMNLYLKRVSATLQDMYSNDCLENEDLTIMMKKNEIEIYEKHFKPQFNLLKEALNSYNTQDNAENNEERRNTDYFYEESNMTLLNSNDENDSVKTFKENFPCELVFRKHCRFIDDVPRHFCQNGNATNFIKLRSIKNKANITHLICADCKMAYKSNCILLYCNFCSLSFYSSINESKIETPYLQPATWEKYHCSMIVNDQMRCVNCKDILYFDLKENLLKCFNDSCKLESDPYSILWVCVTCKKDFQSSAKIFNPLEYKLVRSSIKEALIVKKQAKPDHLPCCPDKYTEEDLTFYHKKECKGIIFLGNMQNRKIIVCEKCRSLSYYEKFIWTCPVCSKRFKNKIEEIISTVNHKERSLTGNTYSKVTSCSNLKYENVSSSNNTFNNLEWDENSTPLSGASKDREGDSKSQLNVDSSNPNSHKINGVNSHSMRSQSSQDINISKVNRMMSKSNPDKEKEYTNSILSNNSEGYVGNIHNAKSYNSPNKEINNDDQNEYNENNRIKSEKSCVKFKLKSSCNLIISVKDQQSNNPEIRRFKHSNTILNHYDNEIESNPARKKTSNHRVNQSTKVSFEDRRCIKSTTSVGKFNKVDNLKNKYLNSSKSILYNKIDLESEFDYEDEYGSHSRNILDEKKNCESELKKNKIDYYSIENFGFNKFDVDEYTIDTQIGEGAYGKIYKIFDKNQNSFAMKKNIIHDNNQIPSIIKQYIIMQKLHHPNILNLKGISLQKLDSTTTSIYVQMDLAKLDWLEEIKLRAVENPKRLYSEVELLNILKQVTAALAYMQKINVVHRDLKPHNILIFENFIYKIADFGETEFLKENPFGDENSKKMEDTKSIRGTELFMSPILYQALKRFKSERDIVHNSYKSDCFSLGLCILNAASLSLDVLYDIRKILCVSKVEDIFNFDFDLEKDNLSLKNILTKEFNKLMIYSNRFEALVCKMLNINERDRPDFIELERILQSFS